MMMTMVSLVLLIALSNIVMLLIARNANIQRAQRVSVSLSRGILLSRLRSLPGVEAVSLAENRPGSGIPQKPIFAAVCQGRENAT